MLGKLFQHVAIFARICFVESSVRLVQDKKWRRVHLRHGKKERDRGERSLAAGERMELFDLFVWKRDVYLYSLFKSDFFFFRRSHFLFQFFWNIFSLLALSHNIKRAVSSAKHQREKLLKFYVYLFYAFLKFYIYLLLEVSNELLQRFDAFRQIFHFFRQESIPLGYFSKLLHNFCTTAHTGIF